MQLLQFQIPISINADGSLFVGANGESGYKTGYRLSLSSGGETADSDYECTGFIPVKYGDVIRIKNVDFTIENATNFVTYDANKNPIKSNNSYYGGQLKVFETEGVALNTNLLPTLTEDLAYIRIGSKSITSESILTVNQEII